MKKILKRILIILGIVFAILLVITMLFGKKKLAPRDVEKIVLETTDFDIKFDSIELDKREIMGFLGLYNFSVNAGSVNVDRPYSDFRVEIYLKNGDTIILRDYRDGKLYYSASGDYCWIYNQSLWNYIEHLIEQHNMARE